MLWGYLILAEDIQPTMILGFIIILSGVYFSSRKPKQKEESIKVSA
jgi:drug/metabolite transporter (DMT)-like permease